MKLDQYIKTKIDKLNKKDTENPLQEIRYILLEKLGLSLEEQIFK